MTLFKFDEERWFPVFLESFIHILKGNGPTSGVPIRGVYLLLLTPLALQGLKPYCRLYHSLSLTAIPSRNLPILDPQGRGVLTNIVNPPHPWSALGPSHNRGRFIDVFFSKITAMQQPHCNRNEENWPLRS